MTERIAATFGPDCALPTCSPFFRIPNITRVFRQDQTLYVYFEVYDPSIDRDLHKPSVTAALDLLSGERDAYKAQPLRLNRLETSRTAGDLR